MLVHYILSKLFLDYTIPSIDDGHYVGSVYALGSVLFLLVSKIYKVSSNLNLRTAQKASCPDILTPKIDRASHS